MSSSLGEAVLDLRADSSPLARDLDDAKSKTAGWIGGLGDIVKTGLGVAFGGVLLGGIKAARDGLLDFAKSASESQQAEAQLDAVLKSTGAAAAEQAQKYADAQGKVTTVITSSKKEQAALTAENKKAAEEYAKLGNQLVHAQAHLTDLQANWDKAKTHTASAAVALDDAKKKVADLSAQLAKGGPEVKSFASSQVSLVQAMGLTPPVAQMSRQALLDMASGLQKVTRFSDETVIGVESLLLTFTSVGKDVFPQATETVLDMATALKEDTKSAAIQLGKALQDPILGVTALKKVGVNFSEAQKAVIKKLVETGQSAKAQQLILKELHTEFGGSARAAGETFAGQLDILNNKFDDVKEKIGGAVLPLLTVLVRTFNDWLSSPIVTNLTDKIVLGIQKLSIVLQDVFGLLRGGSNLIPQLAGDLGALAGVFGLDEKAAAAFVLSTLNGLQSLLDAIKKGDWGAVANIIVGGLQSAWTNGIQPTLVSWGTRFWTWLTDPSTGALAQAGGKLNGLRDSITGWFRDHGPETWDSLVKWGGDAWKWLTGPDGAIQKAGSEIQTLAKRIGTGLSDEWTNTVEPALKKWGDAFWNWLTADGGALDQASAAVTKASEAFVAAMQTEDAKKANQNAGYYMGVDIMTGIGNALSGQGGNNKFYDTINSALKANAAATRAWFQAGSDYLDAMVAGMKQTFNDRFLPVITAWIDAYITVLTKHIAGALADGLIQGMKMLNIPMPTPSAVPSSTIGSGAPFASMPYASGGNSQYASFAQGGMPTFNVKVEIDGQEVKNAVLTATYQDVTGTVNEAMNAGLTD